MVIWPLYKLRRSESRRLALMALATLYHCFLWASERQSRKLAEEDWGEYKVRLRGVGLAIGEKPRNVDFSRNRPSSLYDYYGPCLTDLRVQNFLIEMKVAVLVLFASFLGSATACSWNIDCYGSQICCSGVCSSASSCVTSLCVYNSDCGYGECCSDYECVDCLTTGGIVGVIIGSLIVVAIIVSIVACCCCACCPYYRYRHPGTVVVTAGQPPYQQFVSTTTTSQQMQHPPAAAYGQPPPYHPQPQAGPYPPPQAQAQYPYGPASAAGQPIKQ